MNHFDFALIVKRFVVILFVIFLQTTVVATANAEVKIYEQVAEDFVPVARYGRGALFECNGQRLLYLEGSHYEMGLQHGFLLRDEVKKMVDTVLLVSKAQDAVKEKDFFAGTLYEAVKRAKPFIPERYLEEMKGLADGAGIPFDDVLAANLFPELFHCSGFALFGSATTGGRLLHGRILDYITQIGLQDLATVIIFKGDGQIPLVTVGYSGFIGSVTGMNEEMVAVGELGGRGEGKWDGLPMSLLVRKVLEESYSLEEAVSLFRDAPRTCEYYYVISDGEETDARGLYCTPDFFEVVKPGEEHMKLPKPVEDAVLFSAGARYDTLVDRVKDNYGMIDVNSTLALMERPVAMEGNLHCVLFASKELEFWVANAIHPDEPRYQACFQPYYHYHLAELIKVLPAKTNDAPELTRGPVYADVEGNTADSIEALPLTGVVRSSQNRQPRENDNEDIEDYLGLFQASAEDFEWQMKLVSTQNNYDLYTVQFPSPLLSPVPENNTVYCEYFRAKGDEKRPAVIVLDIAEGSLVIASIICHSLATEGTDALIVKLPYYDERRPAEGVKTKFILSNPFALVRAIRQAVMDVSRARAWLAVQPEVDPERIGICGVSLGGFVAALSAGVDGNYPRAAIVLAGGDLVTVIRQNSSEVSDIVKYLQKTGINEEALRQLLAPIDPLTYAPRLEGSNVLVIGARQDEVVPASCVEKFAEASQAEKVLWYDTDHKGMVWYLPDVLAELQRHFDSHVWLPIQKKIDE